MLTYRVGGVRHPIAQISSPPPKQVAVWADLDAHTYSVSIDGTTPDNATGIPFTNIVDINTVRFMTDEVYQGNFSSRCFDNVILTDH
jgi:hypothetical protein